MKGTFRKYHRLLAIVICFPLLITACTGVGITIADRWFHQSDLSGFLISVHTYRIVGLDPIAPILNGFGLLGLIATGLSMTGLFSRRRLSPNRNRS
jgi:hypothetical protein